MTEFLSLRHQDSTLALWPRYCTLAPGSLISAVARHHTTSTRLPCPSGSALVSRRSSAPFGTQILQMSLSGASFAPAPPSSSVALALSQSLCQPSGSTQSPRLVSGPLPCSSCSGLPGSSHRPHHPGSTDCYLSPLPAPRLFQARLLNAYPPSSVALYGSRYSIYTVYIYFF